MRRHSFKKDIDYRLFYGLIIVMALLLNVIANDALGSGPTCGPCDTYDFDGYTGGWRCGGCIVDCGRCYTCNTSTNPPSCKDKCKSKDCKWCNDCSVGCISRCDPNQCETCDGNGGCPVCDGNENQFCCNGTCYDRRTQKCCWNDATQSGYICDIDCKSCCNGSCCNYRNCEICKNGSCIEARPTNMRETYVEDQGGTLYFEYAWDSTTGDMGDLYNCEVREKVDYPGGDPYYWPSPPWDGWVYNPTLLPDPPIPAVFSELADTHSPPARRKPYCNECVCATQVYQYRCAPSFCTAWNTLLDIGSICRFVSGEDPTWRYSITKSGHYADIFPLP